ncbi:MAG: Fe-S cluster assembly protein SufD, partial [Actinomycetota bacterium]
PEGVEVTAPLGALEVLSVPGASFTQNIVVASRGSRVTFLQGHVSEGLGEAALHLSSTHAVAEEDAALDLVSLQEWTGPVTHFGKLQAVVGSRARVRTTVITMGGEKVRFSPEAVLSGPGGQYAASGLYFADAGQHFEYRTKIEHLAAHTRSDLLYKGALQGKGARSVFVGDVRVAKGAVGTDAFQANRNLILTEGARADSIPFLEIEAADVRCSHAAATGTVDDEHLFYLMARGIPKEQAKRLVVFGFFADVLARVELEGLRERLTASIEEELARGGER